MGGAGHSIAISCLKPVVIYKMFDAKDTDRRWGMGEWERSLLEGSEII